MGAGIPVSVGGTPKFIDFSKELGKDAKLVQQLLLQRRRNRLGTGFNATQILL